MRHLREQSRSSDPCSLSEGILGLTVGVVRGRSSVFVILPVGFPADVAQLFVIDLETASVVFQPQGFPLQMPTMGFFSLQGPAPTVFDPKKFLLYTGTFDPRKRSTALVVIGMPLGTFF